MFTRKHSNVNNIFALACDASSTPTSTPTPADGAKYGKKFSFRSATKCAYELIDEVEIYILLNLYIRTFLWAQTPTQCCDRVWLFVICLPVCLPPPHCCCCFCRKHINLNWLTCLHTYWMWICHRRWISMLLWSVVEVAWVQRNDIFENDNFRFILGCDDERHHVCIAIVFNNRILIKRKTIFYYSLSSLLVDFEHILCVQARAFQITYAIPWGMKMCLFYSAINRITYINNFNEFCCFVRGMWAGRNQGKTLEYGTIDDPITFSVVVRLFSVFTFNSYLVHRLLSLTQK